jgi:dipeptidyl-peptidase-4
MPFCNKFIVAAFAFSATLCAAQTAATRPWTVAEIYSGKTTAGAPPSALIWSPDGTRLTFLKDDELFEVEQATGNSHLLLSAAQLAPIHGEVNEKDRDHRARYGLASYQWGADSNHVLFDEAGRLWLYDLKKGTGTDLGATGAGSGDDPKFSPNGEQISYLKDHNLYLKNVKDGASVTGRNLTGSTDPAILNGEVDWVYLEELDVRSNYFWAPDSKHLAYLQAKEEKVPQYPLVDWLDTHATIDEQRYPQPGDPNPDVRVGVVAAEGGATVWVKLPIVAGQDYIPRFGWVDADTVWVETLTRDHKHLDLYFANAATGNATRVLAQTDNKFFDESYDLEVAKGHVLLTSWRDGHTHLYLYSYDQASPLKQEIKLERQLTQGEFDVEEIVGYSEGGERIFYVANEGNPLERQVWSVRLDGTGKFRVTTEVGVHNANFAPEGGRFVDSYSNRITPGVMQLCVAAVFRGVCTNLWKGKAPEGLALPNYQWVITRAKDGTRLYSDILLPSANSKPDSTIAPGSIPLIVNPYGGPHAQTVMESWTGASGFFDQLLTEHGFAVLHVDNRGMGGRGREFAYAAYHNFGPVQLEDQLTIVDRVLKNFPQLDPKRLGWWGWSWGGSFTLYAMEHSDRFKAGVAVAPVTDWSLYDSIYTERYLSTPAACKECYENFSVTKSAKNLHGRLLLAQGTGDDNVHPANTIQFVQELVTNNIPYDLHLYPRKTHSIAGREARTHLFEAILDHFERNLKGGQ